MKALTIKVLLEHNDIIFRDIEINSEANLEDLHKAILSAFSFEGNQLASFLVSGDGWQAEAEYSLESLSDDDHSHVMKNVKIGDVLKEEGDCLTYIYDYLSEWKFELEVIAIEEKEADSKGKVVNQKGKAPNENEKRLSGDDAQSILMKEILGEDLEEEEGDEDLFNSDDFDSLDDYEEYL
ncbi:MAG: hypothetical protein CMC96_06280 [Flavobacteriales bacterium]|nr:hypothetical protein [Flavobacteriales bacterium]|tara:strand:+ start:25710 stop:26252 length:543 start_codon:yes stop_codon:yes gene_type:complete